MDSMEHEGWNCSDDDEEAGGKQVFYSDDVSVPSTPESIASHNEVSRPKWWKNVPVETRNAVREAELFVALNPCRRHDVGNDYVIWDDYRECLTAAVHRAALSHGSGVARKSAISYLPVQVFSRSPSDSTDNAEDELDLDLDNRQIEPDHDPGPRPATRSRPIGRIAILEINDSSSSQDSAKLVSQSNADAQPKNTSSGHAINILSDSDLEPSPSPAQLNPPKLKSRFQNKSVSDIISPRVKSGSVPESHRKDNLLSTPDRNFPTRTNDKDNNSDESPMFISPIGALEIINKYPARNMKEGGKSTSLPSQLIVSQQKQGQKGQYVEQPDPDLRCSKIARKSAPSVHPDLLTITAKSNKRRHEEDQLEPDSRGSKVARKTASSGRPEPSKINEDPNNRRKTFGQIINIRSSSESPEQEHGQQSRKRLGRDRNIGSRGNIGIRTGRQIQASESSISSEEPPEITAARDKVRAANLLKNKKKKAKKEGALADAAHEADQPREKLYAPRKVLEEKGLRKIAINEGVHATYDKEKEYHRHDKHIRTINTTNKPAPPAVQVERTFEDRERSVSSSPEPEMSPPTNERLELPSPTPSRQQSRNETRQTHTTLRRQFFNRQQHERAMYQSQPYPSTSFRSISRLLSHTSQNSQANPPSPPPPVAPHEPRSHQSFNNRRATQQSHNHQQQQQQQQTRSEMNSRRNEGLPPTGPRQNRVYRHNSSRSSYAQEPTTQGRPSQYPSRQFSSTQSGHSRYSSSQGPSSHHSHRAGFGPTPVPAEDEEFQELKRKIHAEGDNHFWMK